MKPFELEIITPESTIFKGRVSSLIFPAYDGYMGVLSGHASFIGSLGTGKTFFNIVPDPLRGEHQSSSPVRDGTETPNTYFVRDGFIEIISRPFTTTKVTILAENISR